MKNQSIGPNSIRTQEFDSADRGSRLASFVAGSSILAVFFMIALLTPNSLSAVTIHFKPYLMNPTDSSIVVLWRTKEAAPSKVVYGTDSLKMAMEIKDTAQQVQHMVLINSLIPDRKYFYRAISGDYQSPVHHFHTHGPSKKNSFKFMVISDTQKWYSPWTMTEQLNEIMLREDPDFILTVGDNAHISDVNSAYGYKLFFDYLAPALNHIPIYPNAGNHELYNTKGKMNLKAYGVYKEITYQIPTNPPNDHRYYSFSYGDCLFWQLNGSHWADLTRLSGQMAWINGLARKGRGDHKFLFAGYHMPRTRDQVDSLLKKGDVDIVFEGHSHVYKEQNVENIRYLNNGFGDDFFIFDADGDSLHYHAYKFLTHNQGDTTTKLLNKWSIVSKNAAHAIIGGTSETGIGNMILGIRSLSEASVVFRAGMPGLRRGNLTIFTMDGKMVWSHAGQTDSFGNFSATWHRPSTAAKQLPCVAIFKGKKVSISRKFVTGTTIRP